MDIKSKENIRKANVIFNKNGKGNLTTKIVLPVPWTKLLGVSENDREVNIKFENNSIIIYK